MTCPRRWVWSKKLTSWADTLEWIARNTEVRSDVVLAQSFPYVGGVVFLGSRDGEWGGPGRGRGEEEKGKQGFPACARASRASSLTVTSTAILLNISIYLSSISFLFCPLQPHWN